MIVAHPVLEIFREDGFTLWPVAESEPFERLPLRGGLEPAEIGLAVRRIADYMNNDPDDGPPPRPADPYLTVLGELVTQDYLVAPGGVRFTDTTTGVTVPPGCCAGLEEWRCWYDVADGGSVYLGHDPTPGAERVGDTVRLTVDVEDPDSQRIDMPVTELRRLLDGVETDLTEFLGSTATWAAEYVPDYAVPVVEALARLLDLPAPAVPEPFVGPLGPTDR